MAVEAHGRAGLAGRTLARRAGLALAIPALTLALALGGCRAGAARNANNTNPPVTQSTNGNGSPSAANTPGASNSNAALQKLENADNQNQTDQQQINNAGSNAGVDYSSQDMPLNP